MSTSIVAGMIAEPVAFNTSDRRKLPGTRTAGNSPASVEVSRVFVL